MKKKLLAILLTVCMVLSMVPAVLATSVSDCTDAPCAHQAAIGTTHYDTLAEAVYAAQSGDIITLLRDIEVSSKITFTANNVTLTSKAGSTYTVKAADGFTPDSDACFIKVSSGSLTMENVTIDANRQIRAMYVLAGAALTIEDETTIKNGYQSSNYGGGNCGGILVSGTVTMSGGLIDNCDATSIGGGVLLYNGTFTMNGGKITNCFAPNGGGGVSSFAYANSGAFTMTDGEITGNESYYGGGVYMADGKCNTTISGGKIYNNKSTRNDYPADLHANTTTILSGSVEISNTSDDEYSVNYPLHIGGALTGEIEVTCGKDAVVAYAANDYVLTESDLSVFVDKVDNDYNLVLVNNEIHCTNACAMIGNELYSTLQAAIGASDGDTVTLLKDVELNDTLTIAENITLDGKGHSLTPADPSATYNSAIMVGDSGWGDDHGETIKLVDLTLSGWTTNYGVVRVQGVTLEMDGCTMSNNTVTNDAYGVLSLNFADATVENSIFDGNKDKVIDINYNGDDSNAVVTIDNCVFTNNESDGAGIVVRNDGEKLTVANCEFVGNSVSTTGNAATLYAGWGTNDVVTGNLFKDNTVTTTHETTKRFASAIFCDGCTVTDNAFDSNTATRHGDSITTIVAVGAYYGPANVGANFWGGNEPVLGTDYTVEYSNNTVDLDSYHTSYSTGDDGNVVLDNEKNMPVAQIGNTKYDTLAAAVNAVQNGEIITLLADNAETVYVSRDVAFTLAVADGKTFTGDILAGNHTTRTVDETEDGTAYTFDYTAPVYADAPSSKPTTDKKNPFVDVPDNAYYADAVLWAVENGITTGTSATNFSPNAVCTRAQVVTFLWRAAGSPEPAGAANAFDDVASSAYYAKAVQWAVEQGITLGTGDNKFSPDAECTRGQIVTFLWRSQGSENAAVNNPFVDVADGAYYEDAVLWAVEEAITNGTGADTFSPDADCTRGQIVTFLYRCMVDEK